MSYVQTKRFVTLEDFCRLGEAAYGNAKVCVVLHHHDVIFCGSFPEEGELMLVESGARLVGESYYKDEEAGVFMVGEDYHDFRPVSVYVDFARYTEFGTENFRATFKLISNKSLFKHPDRDFLLCHWMVGEDYHLEYLSMPEEDEVEELETEEGTYVFVNGERSDCHSLDEFYSSCPDLYTVPDEDFFHEEVRSWLENNIFDLERVWFFDKRSNRWNFHPNAIGSLYKKMVDHHTATQPDDYDIYCESPNLVAIMRNTARRWVQEGFHPHDAWRLIMMDKTTEQAVELRRKGEC